MNLAPPQNPIQKSDKDSLETVSNMMSKIERLVIMMALKL
jgi:hypothetical protein